MSVAKFHGCERGGIERQFLKKVSYGEERGHGSFGDQRGF